ncbi:MAG: aldehyde ferredoxin oxidoreductase C-terminal domain-containing protein [Saccharofermentanales bacterium]
MSFGYHGKILYVDLTHKSFREQKPSEIEYRRYGSGSVMAVTKLLLETPVGIDAFDPEAYLMFFNGILGGHRAPGLARFTITGKSPATGGIGEARCEGPFAHALKRSGYDGIIFHGKSEQPVMLLIEDQIPQLISAEEVWGEKVSDTVEKIKADYPDSSIAAIGPAGENKVRFANVICDQNHQASRAGMGAVMGSKNLKAVVITSGHMPEVFAPDQLEEISLNFVKKMQENTLSMWQYNRPGFGAWIHTHGIDAALCVNNYQTSKCDYTDQFTPEKFAEFYKGESPCPYCPNNCIKRYATDSDNEFMGGLHQEALGSLGPNIGNSDLKKIIQANVLCNEYGMDPNSLGFTISFAQEAKQNGTLDESLLSGLNLDFSPDVDLEKLTIMIAKRQGLGDILAEGAALAAEKIGNDSQKFAMTVKGNELVSTECRSQTNLALGYATAAVGPRYDICEHDWDYDTEVGWDHSMNYSRTLGILERIPMYYSGPEKVNDYKVLNNLWSAVDALGMCLFASAPTRVYSLQEMADLFRQVTGFETSSYEIMRLGELKNHLFRLYNYREGFSKKDDKLPDRFFEQEINAGALAGKKLDREQFEYNIVFYYQMMGWDESGCPRRATLYDYGVDWADRILDEM